MTQSCCNHPYLLSPIAIFHTHANVVHQIRVVFSLCALVACGCGFCVLPTFFDHAAVGCRVDYATFDYAAFDYAKFDYAGGAG